MGMDVEFQRLASALGAACSERRRALGLTQEEFAELCAITPGHVARLERGERLPSAVLLDRLTRTLRVDIQDIWPRQGAKAAKESQLRYSEQSRREHAIARLIKIVDPLSANEIRQLASLIQQLMRSGKRAIPAKKG